MICSVLVQALAKCLALAPQPQIPKEQKGRTWSEVWDVPGTENTGVYWCPHCHKETAPGGEVPPEGAALLIPMPNLPPLKLWGAFSHLWDFHTECPKLVNKATAKVTRQEQGAGYISPAHSTVPGTSDRPGRRSGSTGKRNSCFSKPYSMPHGGGAQICLGDTSVQFLCAAAQTQHVWRYTGCGLTVFTEKTKSNWTKSVFD